MGFNWSKVSLHKIGTPEVTKRNYENIQKLKAKPPTAAPTARGFTTSKRKTKSSKKTCRTSKRKK